MSTLDVASENDDGGIEQRTFNEARFMQVRASIALPTTCAYQMQCPVRVKIELY
jgi:hypothetical protein